jgi:hypothetical protein
MSAEDWPGQIVEGTGWCSCLQLAICVADVLVWAC